MKLILKENSRVNATAFYLENLYKEHFELTTDTSADGIVYADFLELDWALTLDKKIIIDHTWDVNDGSIKETDQIKIIEHGSWFFPANECLWYRALGYHNYIPKNINDLDFLMLINRQKPWRDEVWKNTEPLRKNSLSSYHAHNISIPGDIDPESGPWQRYTNFDWYDRTKYSVVVETGLDLVCITEKILKPNAFRHPYVVFATPNSLSEMKSLGFETFDNCINESYDLETDGYKRMDMILDEIKRLNSTDKDYFLDPETEKRIEHNFHRFYDINWAKQQFKKYIFDFINEHGQT